MKQVHIGYHSFTESGIVEEVANVLLKIYDYAGCLWPEGYMDKEHSYVFNHEDIDILYYLGMQDIEEFNFRSKLDELMKKIRK